MKAILEFNLPEDRDAHTLSINASKYFCCLFELDQEMRNCLKYGHSYKDVEELAQYVRDYISEEVNLDEVS